MDTDPHRSNRPVSDALPPPVYFLLFGATLWFVLAIWGFAGDGYTDYLLAIVSGFLFAAVALPCILWRAWWKQEGADASPAERRSLREWAAGEFATWQDRVKGANAAIEILLPIAAAALGMTAFGALFHLVAHGAV